MLVIFEQLLTFLMRMNALTSDNKSMNTTLLIRNTHFKFINSLFFHKVVSTCLIWSICSFMSSKINNNKLGHKGFENEVIICLSVLGVFDNLSGITTPSFVLNAIFHLSLGRILI